MLWARGPQQCLESHLELRSLPFESTASGRDRHLAQEALDDYAEALRMTLGDAPNPHL